MKTIFNFSTRNGFTALPSVTLPGTPSEGKARAVEIIQETGGKTDVYTFTAICRFPGMRRKTAFDYSADGRALSPNGRAV